MAVEDGSGYDRDENAATQAQTFGELAEGASGLEKPLWAIAQMLAWVVYEMRREMRRKAASRQIRGRPGP
jgi:hypothetical protein